MATLYIIGLIFIGYALCTFFIVTTHELGHALAYLIFTKPEKITITIGAEKPNSKALRFKFGKLHFIITSKAFTSCSGSCASSTQELNYKNEIIILLAGNLTTLALSVALLFFAFYSDWHGAIKLFSIALLIYSLYIAHYNLLSNKASSRTDGGRIISTVKLSKSYSDYAKGCEALANMDYNNAIIHFETANISQPHDTNILRYLLGCYTGLRDTENSLRIYSQFKDQPNLTEHDFLLLGYLNSITRNSETAIDYYNQALSYPATYKYATLNLAFEMVMSGQYALADEKLSSLLNNYPEDGEACGYLGYSKIMQGELEAGKAMIDTYFKNGGNNPYIYKALGIYYMEINDITKARENFDKAKQLDSWVDVDDYITQLSN